VHDIVTGSDGATALTAGLSINRSNAIGLTSNNGESGADADDGLASEIVCRLDRAVIGGAAPAWVAGDRVRITSASGRVYDFTAGAAQVLGTNTFEAGTSITATVLSLKACIDQHPGLDMVDDGAMAGGNMTSDAAGDIAIYDIMGRGVDAGVQLEVFSVADLSTALGGPGTADGFSVFTTGADLAAAVAPGAAGTVPDGTASNFTDAGYQNAQSGGVGGAGGTTDNLNHSQVAAIAVEFDEFPVQIVYNVPANDLLHQVGDYGFTVSWVIA
jgi:hypothetical protein